MNGTAGANARYQPKFVRTLHDVDIEQRPLVKHSQIDCLLRRPPQICQDRPRYSLKGCTPGCAGRHLCQLWADKVCSRIRAQEIAFTFEMSEETVCCAFIDPSVIANRFQTQSG